MLTNSAEFNRLELKVLFEESNLINIDENLEIIGISTDSRAIQSRNAFLALIGEKFDGHDKVRSALDAGAACAVVNKSWYELPLILVDDTLKALAMLANHHRRKFKIPVVAIAGSNGKTTTKEILAHILSANYSILKTHQNFNNQVGVPLMLLQLSSEHEGAVLEIGTNEPGEIAVLSGMVAPTHGLITNIGKEHLEKLIDLAGVEMEETFLFGFLHKFGGASIINNDDERLRKYAMLLDDKLLFGVVEGSELRAEIELDAMLSPTLRFNYKDKEDNENIAVAKMQAGGLALAYNAIAAAAVAVKLGLDLTKITEQLETYQQDESHDYARMTVEYVAENVILNDCYNANPDSMIMSLASLEKISSDGRKYAVLGDMLEMGETAMEEHKAILELATEKCDMVFLFGDTFGIAAASQANGKVHHFDDKTELLDILNEQIDKKDVVLFKGSRGMRLEEIITNFKEKNL
jgi:UDP-N-acetylmuramoyl-tripeptide--D-alanyl-D-alanine ligase